MEKLDMKIGTLNRPIIKLTERICVYTVIKYCVTSFSAIISEFPDRALKDSEFFPRLDAILSHPT